MCKAQYEEGYSKMDMQWVKIKRRVKKIEKPRFKKFEMHGNLPLGAVVSASNERQLGALYTYQTNKM